MDSSFRRELQSLLPKAAPFSLPQLFVGGKLVGGAEEVRALLDSGELVRVLEKVRRVDPTFVCRSCGGARFLPCGDCSGSRKIFVEDEGRLRRCEGCNENGLKLERCKMDEGRIYAEV
ncbi:glutaredoxin domain-containing cysteine-rich protein 1-like [Asparagus officinalis]|uniref:glutaredoxin domain-containing cysteine-rich protein 1-like n=1 Tax=Asparagus officinalis TaxID=4686 RepID=UPI00098E3D35|nr:glutaredoxin domain-containing cysteine-rich protein 1-like [Asparagus officinalis]